MSRIVALETQLGSAREELERVGRVAERAPEDFAQSLARKSMETHVADIQTQLREGKERRAHEVLQVRLSGELVQHGSVPLSLFSGLLTALGDAVNAAAQKIQYGRRVGRISSRVVKDLNLRLADVAPGSARIFIRGDLNPDLFGYSALEEALARVFEVLEASEQNHLSSAVADVGFRSAKGIREFLEYAHGSGLDVEFSWPTPANEVRQWSASSNTSGHLASLLGTFKSSEPEVVRMTGEVITLSLRGKFEISGEGRVVKADFGRNLVGKIQEIHLGQDVLATFERLVITNTVSGAQKSEFTLIDVEPTGQEEIL